MAAVEIDPAVLLRTGRELQSYAERVSALRSRASALGAGWALAPLTATQEWAGDTIADLSARIALVEAANNQIVAGLRAVGFSPMELAAASAPVSQSVAGVLRVLQLSRSEPLNVTWKRRPDESLDDWVTRLEGQAIDRLPYLGGAGPVAAEVYDWYSTYGNLVYAGGLSALAAKTLAITETAQWVVPKLQGLRASSTTMSLGQRAALWYLQPKTTYAAPFSGRGLIGNNLIKGLNQYEGMAGAPPWLQRAATHSGNIFGRPWVDAAGTTFGRGQSNLISVAQESAAGSRLATLGRTAGFLRGAGVVGGVVSSGYDIANIASQGNPIEAFKRDKAGYVADYAKLGLDASLTAALIAPNPVTWGAVAVTGVIYGGAELVDHWDDVTAATSDAAHWAGDQADKVVDSVGDGLGDAVDTVKDSKVNPMNWF